MGKSTSSCLKIITCGRGGDEAHDDGDLISPESKASSGKRRWSFRKKSCSQRVLSNTVISEPVSVGYSKESIDVTTDNFQPSKESSIQEKLLILERPKETAPLSLAVVNPDIVTNSLVTDGNIAVADHTVQESVAVVIQVSIRIFLARRELQKLKNVVKLQAAVRGHLVRRQAVGTLCCVQAIAKMQSLVRARLARNLAEKFDAHKDKNFHMGRRNGKMNKENSTEKLLSNGFARQLLESTPKTKPINIKCDPSKSDSAWKWLERWMAVTSSEVGQRQRQDYDQLYKRQEESSKLHDHEAAVDEDMFAAVSISSDSKSGPSETVVPTEIQKNLSTKDFGGFEFQSLDNARDSCVNSLAMGDKDQSLVENKSIGTKPDYDRKLESVVENTDSFLGQIPSQSDVTSQLVLDSIPDKGESDSNNSKPINKRDSREPLETEGKKFVSGTRKPCNPAFAAVQSKFEELSSTTSLGRSVSSCLDATSEVEPLSNTKNHSLSENSFSHDPGAQLAASECGTEISISSTLDSPDRSEAEGGEIVIELGALEKQNYDVNGAGDNSLNMVHTNAEANNSSLDLQFLQSEREEELDRNTEKSIAASDAVGMEKQTEDLITSDMRAQAGNVVDPQAYKSSPEGTPRSHATAFESHGTPSSQASVNAKKSKGDNKILTKKQRAQLIGKKSPSNPNNDSDGSSAEHLPKESKKRRNSLGVAIHEQVDHEPRTSSSNSIPSYMQATESAKAKAHATISPKSSPDVHDKDIHMKKRHSLPIGNGKQGSSPRMQRSASKANGTRSPHNSAERRWQR